MIDRARRSGGGRFFACRAACVGVLLVVASVGLGCQEERDPYKPLSTDEGASLMREIRDDRGRAQELTPAEKKFLSDALKKR